MSPTPLWFRGGGTHSLAKEGVGGSQFRHCGTLGIFVYFVVTIVRYLVKDDSLVGEHITGFFPVPKGKLLRVSKNNIAINTAETLYL